MIFLNQTSKLKCTVGKKKKERERKTDKNPRVTLNISIFELLQKKKRNSHSTGNYALFQFMFLKKKD